MTEHVQISVEDAEEYTQALEQSLSGGWRQTLLAVRLRVPEALGLTVPEWQQRLGGYVKLSIPERREAVAELTAEGLTTREAAEVLGVDHSTVVRDAGANAPPEPEPASEPQVEAAPEPDAGANAPPEPEPELPLEEPPPDPPESARTEAAWLLVQHAEFWARVSKAPQFFDPDDIASLLDEDERGRVLSSLTNHRRWLDRYEQALRATNLRVVK